MAVWKPCRGNSIVLVGFMGAGKSTVAESLAGEIGFRAVDLDRVIAERAGRSIPAIFAQEGEERFRELETAALQSVQSIRRMVLATGGGIVSRPLNWEIMRGLGPVIYLQASWPVLQGRIAAGSGRPLADDQDPRRIEDLWRRRLPLYAQADLTVDTDGREPEQIAAEILQRAGEGGL